MGVNSLPKTLTRQRRDCDLNPGPSAPEFSTQTTRLPLIYIILKCFSLSFSLFSLLFYQPTRSARSAGEEGV